MIKDFEVEVTGLGMNRTGYPGAFTPTVKQIIENTIQGKILHLFSGQSLIGEERVDIEHKNATIKKDVKEFLRTDNRNWDWILLDPPYQLGADFVKVYKIKRPIACDTTLRNLIKSYAREHTKNILWLDLSAPMVEGFRRKKLWFLLPGGFHNVRVLSWLEKNEEKRTKKQAN